MEATVFLGTFNAAEMTNHLNLPQVDSNQVEETSKDDQWKQDGPELNFQPHSKGSENVCKEGFFKIFFSLIKTICYRFVIMGYCV